MKITAKEVNELRKATGAGMMDCKKALQEAEGNMNDAIDILRKKGQKVASKRADREAGEGVVLAKVSDDKKFGAVVMINCETDFVAKNEEFVGFVQSIIDLAVVNKAKNSDELNAMMLEDSTVADAIIEKTGVIGEKIQLGNYQIVEGESVYAYTHNGNRIASIVALNKAGEFDVAGKDVAMQIAAMDPVALNKDQVSEEVKQHEINIGMEQARAEGKPEAMLEKIAMGRLNKFFKENTLLAQAFIKNSKQNVADYLKTNDAELTVVAFKRLALAV